MCVTLGPLRSRCQVGVKCSRILWGEIRVWEKTGQELKGWVKTPGSKVVWLQQRRVWRLGEVPQNALLSQEWSAGLLESSGAKGVLSQGHPSLQSLPCSIIVETAIGMVMNFRAQKLGPSFKYFFQSFVHRMRRIFCVIKMHQIPKASESLHSHTLLI